MGSDERATLYVVLGRSEGHELRAEDGRVYRGAGAYVVAGPECGAFGVSGKE